MKPYKVNLADLTWSSYTHGRFGSEDLDLAGAVCARKLDYVLTRIAPGKTATPYHFHHAGEELFFVMEGAGRLRYDGNERPISAGDFISCPPGSASAHQFINDSDTSLTYLAVSTNEPLEVIEYPDSDKVMVKAVAQNDAKPFTGVFRQGAAVDYWHGET